MTDLQNFPDQVPLSRARADLGPLVRWTARTGERVAITSRGHVAAVLISCTELAALDQCAQRHCMPSQPHPGRPGSQGAQA